jgi:hypothetical protein
MKDRPWRHSSLQESEYRRPDGRPNNRASPVCRFDSHHFDPHHPALAVLTAFCATLGLHGPPAFSDVLALPSTQMGRASALMVLLLLGAGTALRQAIALFLMHWQFGAVAAAMALSAWLCFALVARDPAREHGPG